MNKHFNRLVLGLGYVVGVAILMALIVVPAILADEYHNHLFYLGYIPSVGVLVYLLGYGVENNG